MNQVICDRCKRIISSGPLITGYRWQRTHPDGKSVNYDLCGGCDTSTVEGIVMWDDPAFTKHPRS